MKKFGCPKSFIIRRFHCIWLHNNSEKNQMCQLHGTWIKGSMHQVHITNKVVSHYANSSLGERCFVYLLDLYISKLSPQAVERNVFYCKPIKYAVARKPWYLNTPIGHNALNKTLKDTFISTGLDAKNISNHRLRATGMMKLYMKEFQKN